eukprot:TRINITY_DN1203_c0_g3_i2.p1 TRINITY_DN1203_c0_g3~~TRINITY_DN1203_c0_g3_i2.p1  ORF type:complete len:187 (-),score=118.27 TRINITY_DN1203_c0_g3_i2:94-654(-)
MDVWSIELVHGRGVGVDGAYAFKQFASEVDAWTECVGALHARHMAQVDVKPDNAVVLDGGDGVRVRLVDFGHAARTDADGRATVTVPTMTHGYRPPSIAALCFEHRRGEQHTVDARAADTHALGVSLRELEGDGDGDGDGTLLYALAGRLLEDSAEPLSIDALLAVQQAWSPIARVTTVPKARCDI